MSPFTTSAHVEQYCEEASSNHLEHFKLTNSSAPNSNHTYGKSAQCVNRAVCLVWISEHLIPYLGTLEPCVDMHRTVSYIAWSYWGQERSGGTEALQMFFISGPQGKSVTVTPGSFSSVLGGRAVMLCHSLAIWLQISVLKDSTRTALHTDCVM